MLWCARWRYQHVQQSVDIHVDLYNRVLKRHLVLPLEQIVLSYATNFLVHTYHRQHDSTGHQRATTGRNSNDQQ